jgi:glycosyltransferase involved in cell wall biosynthesis
MFLKRRSRAEFIDFDELKERYQQVPVREYPNCVCEAVPAPVVSVKVSAYQHADFIKDCLNGILMQETEFPIEILIGEDESADGTREICREYADEHPDKIRLFLHRRENNIEIHGRPTGAFQVAYTSFMCRGKYIAYCEGDDYWTDSDKLQRQVNFLEEKSKYSLCYHPWVSVEPGKNSKIEKKNIKSRIQLNTVMHRNLIEKYPEGMLEVLNSDTFLVEYLSKYGKFIIDRSIGVTVHRENKRSTYNPLSQKSKALTSLYTRLKILDYMESEESKDDAVKRFRWFFNSDSDGENLPQTRKCFLRCVSLLLRHGLFVRAALYTVKMEIGRILPNKVEEVMKLLYRLYKK